MASKAAKQTPSKTGGKKKLKLKLNKETLRDLSAADKAIKGGRMGGDTDRPTCSCAACS